MDNTAPSSSKRRKTSSPDNNDSTLCLANMPHDHLTAIADYLPKTSRALFAVALTAPSKSFRTSNWKGKLSEASKAIISSTVSAPIPLSDDGKKYESYEQERLEKYYKAGWETLLFLDIREIADKLTDDDIGAVMVCIDAKNKLKTLLVDSGHKCKLSIVGHGLKPLCESKVLEKISFIMVGTKLISESVVITVLDSIVDTDGNSLKIIELPDEWTKKWVKGERESQLNGFLEKFNQILSAGKSTCIIDTCQRTLDENNTGMTCFACLTTLCSHCEGSSDYPIMTCDNCDISLCTWCEQDFAECRECSSKFCSLCAAKDDVDAAKQCNYCYGDPICFECVTPENENCEACLGKHTK